MSYNHFCFLQNILTERCFNGRLKAVSLFVFFFFCEDFGVKLFLRSLNADLNLCNCCLSGHLKVGTGVSWNAPCCVSAQIESSKQPHWRVLSTDCRAEQGHKFVPGCSPRGAISNEYVTCPITVIFFF